MKKFTCLSHPLITHKLTKLRAKGTSPLEFRSSLNDLSTFIAYESCRDLKMKDIEIETPLEKMTAQTISENIILVPVLRAGLGMLDGFLTAMPFARIALAGIYRDKLMDHTVEYYFKLPADHQGKEAWLIDPILATGDTAIAAIERLKEYGLAKIKFISLLSSKVGVERVHEAHPDVEIITANVERELNDKGYLLPGIGDAGDRIFHTEDTL